MTPTDEFGGVKLFHADCRAVLPSLPDGSVDAVITDPPYPEIDRDYGRLSEAEWFDLMNPVVEQCRRILKPTGSAVFVLQPNSERVGRMRTWLWEFMAKWGREWGVVQDAYWWNTAAIPEAHAIQGRLMRPSIKPCVWLGSPDCWRDQDAVLWDEAELSRVASNCARARNEGRTNQPSGHGTRRANGSDAAARRGGVTPFNVIPTTHGQGKSAGVAAAHGHGAGTPMILCQWWTRYICPPGGVVLDPFIGSGTVGLAAYTSGRTVIGVEQHPTHYATALKRLRHADGAGSLFDRQLTIGDEA